MLDAENSGLDSDICINEAISPYLPKWFFMTSIREELQICLSLGQDSFCDWSVKNRMEDLAHEDVHKHMKLWYEIAVDEQNKELRDYKKRLKAQSKFPKIESVPLTIEKDLPQGGQGHRINEGE